MDLENIMSQENTKKSTFKKLMNDFVIKCILTGHCNINKGFCTKGNVNNRLIDFL